MQRTTRHSAIRFLSTPSARRATLSTSYVRHSRFNFYPRPPRGGRLKLKMSNTGLTIISIHALREEGDVWSVRTTASPMIFLSTPSARRATYERRLCDVLVPISIHALREEGDEHGFIMGLAVVHFYPRPPRGGRPLMQTDTVTQSLFLSTPSARRATGSRRPGPAASSISIHALREEGDVQRVIDCVQFFEFLSTPSARRAT